MKFVNKKRNRREFIKKHIDPISSSILEIGALNSPTFSKAEANSYFADRLPKEALINVYPNKSNIIPVDYVIKGRNISTCFDRKFDLIIANHVIEHIPDVLKWMQELSLISHSGTKLALAIPDRRYTFDIVRTETNAAQLLECFVNKIDKPTFSHLFGHLFYYKKVTGKDVWDGKELPIDHCRFTPGHAYKRALEMKDSYHSVHCHIFTTSSFVKVIGEIEQIGLIPWRLIAVEDVKPGQNEFQVMFTLR